MAEHHEKNARDGGIKDTHNRGSGSRVEHGGKAGKKSHPAMIVVVLVIGIVLGIALGSYLSASAPSASVTQAQASEKAVSYINSVLQGQSTAKVLSINESNGLYSMKIDVGGQLYDSFITKDGNLLFPSGINLEEQDAAQTESPDKAVTPKSDKPKVELFVMSFCPYGVQAEGFMKPVADLLGSKAEIKIRFIAQAGSDIYSIQSLHGPAEAREDLRQLCIMKNYPGKYWNYLSVFNQNCYPVYRNATALDSCWKSSASSAEIESAKIESCVNADALALLKLDEQAANSYGVSGSPTLIINGATYGGARSSEDFKNAICSAFNNPPAECSQNVGTASQPVDEAPHAGCG